MDALTCLKELSTEMDLEPSEESGNRSAAVERKQRAIFTTEATLPNGKRITLLKSLLSSACENDCNYCPFRSGRDTQRVTLKPEEFSTIFMNLVRAGIAQGLFISSGVVQGGVHTQDKLLDLAEILRLRMGFRGYLHLKLMPGAERAQVERAMQLADRVSVNLEAPNNLRLQTLAPSKRFIEDLIQPLRWVHEIRQSQPAHLGWNRRWPSSTTQFVMGASGESDLELLATTEKLNTYAGLRRAYFSPFRPIADTPMENHPATSKVRESRLYQASFLLRDYGFKLEELTFDDSQNLPLSRDPKQLWAENNLKEKPVEINQAAPEELLRIPGIGQKGVEAILGGRRKNKLCDLSHLTALGIQSQRAAPFILLNGKRPIYQMSLW
ncbi:MAG: radical SAM protein [Chloroflexota bacterium]